MNCDCRKDIEAKLLDKFKEAFPTNTEHSAELGNYGIVIAQGGCKSTPYLPINYTSKRKVKATGEWKAVKQTASMFFNYCPFCGKPAKEKK